MPSKPGLSWECRALPFPGFNPFPYPRYSITRIVLGVYCTQIVSRTLARFGQ